MGVRNARAPWNICLEAAMAEVRGQEGEVRRQKTGDRGQRSGDMRQKIEGRRREAGAIGG